MMTRPSGAWTKATDNDREAKMRALLDELASAANAPVAANGAKMAVEGAMEGEDDSCCPTCGQPLPDPEGVPADAMADAATDADMPA